MIFQVSICHVSGNMIRENVCYSKGRGHIEHQEIDALDGKVKITRHLYFLIILYI